MAHVMRRCILISGLLAALAMPVAAQRAAPGTGGSMPLAEVMAVGKKYPNLINQIRLLLLAAGKKKDAVVCSADRYSNDWAQLGGARIGPYVCTIGARTLRISSTVSYYDRNGHRLKADDVNLRAKAARAVESGLKWQWQ